MFLIRRNKFLFMVIVLVAVNIAVFWYFSQTLNDDGNDNFTIEGNERQRSILDVTIVIPTFEHFDHDLVNTVKDIHKHYPTLNILILSETLPYPYPNVNNERVKFVYKHINPNIPKSKMDPLNYVHTNNILIIPDGTRIEKESIEYLLNKKRLDNAHIVVAPVVVSKCLSIDFDLKLWTLLYSEQTDWKNCDFIDRSAILFNKKILSNFSETFVPPFYKSFYIQAKLNNLKLAVERDRKLFRIGKILFADPHFQWKHNTNIERQQKALYKRFGVKRLVISSGQEKWFGCSKDTPRCFPSVIDVPYFLYQSRWTPPCCLNNLRKTARHVFSSFEKLGIEYWLEGGSLLGAARHGDIIPWDYDVDIGMYMGDIEKTLFLKKIWDGEKAVDGEGFAWERATEGDFFRVQYSKINHLHVDIFPFYEKNGVMTKNTWFKSHRQDMEFPAWFLKPLKRLKFVGVYAMVPNHHREFLEMKFGAGVIEKPQYPFPEKLLGVSFSN